MYIIVFYTSLFTWIVRYPSCDRSA